MFKPKAAIALSAPPGAIKHPPATFLPAISGSAYAPISLGFKTLGKITSSLPNASFIKSRL
ncbi:Uncharacterised protein [Chlamydia trachomatis]|nr:Uncharacterised protein [Chlamydia trachomatis]